MQAVREAFEAARQDPGRLDAAAGVVGTALVATPGRPVLLAYRGALEAMQAGAAVLPWIKMRHANAAAALLDEAHARRLEVAMAPQDRAGWPADLEILLLRGIALANFPSFLGRTEVARQSLEAARAHPAFTRVPVRYRALACAHLAVLCHRGREAETARDHLESALRADAPVADQIWAAR